MNRTWNPLKRTLRFVVVGLLLASVLLERSFCLAQSNDVYSLITTPSTLLTGFRVAVVSVHPIWVFGPTKHAFGIEECRYWTDSAGRAVPWPANRAMQPGDKQHRYTRFCLGYFSLSIPLLPLNVAFVGGILVLLLVSIPAVRLIRGRAQLNEGTVNP